MKFSFFLFFIFYLNFYPCFSQSDDLYVLYEKTGLNGSKNTEHLFVRDSAAIYVKDPIYKENNEDNKRFQKDDGSITVEIREKITQVGLLKYYINRNSSVVSLETTDNHLVIDSLPSFNWRFFPNEDKMIDGHLCGKAEVKFRGTKLHAYYAKDIPVSLGPWKFRGLPGLILQIYTVDGELFAWQAKKIKTNIFKELDFSPSDKLIKITLEERQKQSDRERKERDKRSRSKLPSGVTQTSYTLNRIDIEKIYEWEQENENN